MLDPDGDGVFEVTLDTTGLAGSYGYKFVVDGDSWIYDPANPMRMHVDGTENSKVLIDDCNRPQLELESLEYSATAIRAVVAVRMEHLHRDLIVSAVVRYGTAIADGTIAVYDERVSDLL